MRQVGHGSSLELRCFTGTKDMDGVEMLAGSIVRLATTSDSRLIAADNRRGKLPVKRAEPCCNAEPCVESLRPVSLGRLRAASLATSNLPRGHWVSGNQFFQQNCNWACVVH